MAILRRLIVLLAFIVVAGCSSVTITHDYDHGADFNKYRTYAWLPSQTSSGESEIFLNNVQHALQRELDAKGMKVDAADPDMSIAMHFGKEQQVQVVDSGYMYGRSGAWAGSRNIQVMRYDEGTLIIDFIDAATKQLIWRGTATAVINPYADAEQRRERIDQGIKEMLADYPPR